MNAVELHNVYQQYGAMAVLDNISLTLAEGRYWACLAIMAPAKPPLYV